MKSRTLTCVVAVVLFAVLAVPQRLLAQEQEPADNEISAYTVTDLGTFGEAFALAQGISNRGWIDGIFGHDSGEQHEFLLRNGVLNDLGTLGGPKQRSR